MSHPRPIPPTRKKKPTTEPITESQLQASIIKLLRKHGYIVLRTNAGLINIDGRWINLGEKDRADLHACGPGGLFIAIEVKRKGNKPTPGQLKYLEEVKATGGFAFWADDIKTVKEMLEL